MRKTLTTAALVFALCCTASAGEMHTPAAPAPPQANTAQEPETQATAEDGTQGTYVQTVLELLAVLPSLL